MVDSFPQNVTLMKNESHEVANYLENAYNLRKYLLYR